jgi:glutaminase
MPVLKTVVEEIAAEMRGRPDRGEVASYIPELARVDPAAFGLAVIDADGEVALGGDAETPFSIQSVSKVFTFTLALGMVGERLWKRVGREPSGSPFQFDRPTRAGARNSAQPFHQRRRDCSHRRHSLRPPAARGAR